MLERINEIRKQSSGGYARPKSQRDNHLDYSKVDWQRLQDQLDGTPHGDKKWVIHFWTQRLACSRDTIYLGLRKFKVEDKVKVKAKDEVEDYERI